MVKRKGGKLEIVWVDVR